MVEIVSGLMDRRRGITRQTHLLPAVWLRLLETDTKNTACERELNTEADSSRLGPPYPDKLSKKKKKKNFMIILMIIPRFIME